MSCRRSVCNSKSFGEVAMHLKFTSHRSFGRDFLERQFWLLLTVIAFVFLATIVARAEDRIIRIENQKYGTAVLLKGGSQNPS